MAKGLRSKVKRRLRTARRAHFDEIQGKRDLALLSTKLNDPHYDLKLDCK
jgi:hypothetical protein